MLPAEHSFSHHLLAATATYLGIVFLVLWLIVRKGHRPRPGEPVPGPVEMARHIVAGMYYCNPNDPRGWVPKSGDPARSSGYTVNMRYRSWVTAYNVLLAVGTLIYIVLIIL